MLLMSVLGAYLAIALPQKPSVPPSGSISVAVLTFYLVATAWMTVRREAGRIGRFEYGAFCLAAIIAAALLIFGLLAASGTGARPGIYAPYFVFASFAAFAAALDFKVIRQGGISGAARIARHLWRMCFALFFAAAFFFIGQQKVMPASLHGSPVLLALGFAPLAFMAFWLVRVRLTSWFARAAPAS